MIGQVEPRDPWVDRLSDYVDGELSGRERRACEEHIARCTVCTASLHELREVVARATRMNRPSEPGQDLWPGIARRLAARPHPRALRLPRLLGWPRPQLAAAALLVFACLTIAIWTLHVRSGRSTERAGARPIASPVASLPADHEYDRTVAELHREADARLTLDPHLVEVLDENVATLDAAIANYRDALAQDPGDPQLRRRLDAARQKKLEVLQQAVTLASEGTE